MKMKGQILISLILLSSILTINAQTLSFPWGEYIGTSTASYKPIIKTSWESGIGDYVGFYTSGNDVNNSNEKMRLVLNGNFGIGTTTPGYKLDVNGTFHVAAGNESKIDLGNWGHTFYFTDGAVNRISFGTWRTNPSSSNLARIGMFDEDGTTQKVMISTRGYSYFNGGDIGIGTTSPAYKLDVCGTIRAKEVKVDLQGTCPDFVFKNDYKLMDLKELESFVKINKHLPEISSEKEMTENGVNVNELQIKLLQKIEELTLYTIEQNKQNEQQSAKIKALEEKIAKLEAASK